MIPHHAIVKSFQAWLVKKVEKHQKMKPPQRAAPTMFSTKAPITPIQAQRNLPTKTTTRPTKKIANIVAILIKIFKVNNKGKSILKLLGN